MPASTRLYRTGCATRTAHAVVSALGMGAILSNIEVGGQAVRLVTYSTALEQFICKAVECGSAGKLHELQRSELKAVARGTA